MNTSDANKPCADAKVSVAPPTAPGGTNNKLESLAAAPDTSGGNCANGITAATAGAATANNPKTTTVKKLAKSMKKAAGKTVGKDSKRAAPKAVFAHAGVDSHIYAVLNSTKVYVRDLCAHRLKRKRDEKDDTIRDIKNKKTGLHTKIQELQSRLEECQKTIESLDDQKMKVESDYKTVEQEHEKKVQMWDTITNPVDTGSRVDTFNKDTAKGSLTALYDSVQNLIEFNKK